MPQSRKISKMAYVLQLQCLATQSGGRLSMTVLMPHQCCTCMSSSLPAPSSICTRHCHAARPINLSGHDRSCVMLRSAFEFALHSSRRHHSTPAELPEYFGELGTAQSSALWWHSDEMSLLLLPSDMLMKQYSCCCCGAGATSSTCWAWQAARPQMPCHCVAAALQQVTHPALRMFSAWQTC